MPLIEPLERRAVFGPRLAPVIKPGCGNIGVAEPLLILCDGGLVINSKLVVLGLVNLQKPGTYKLSL